MVQGQSAKTKTKLEKETKVSDMQFNQSQQEDPVDDVDNIKMTVLSPGM